MNLISNKVTEVFQCRENDNLCFGYGGKPGSVERMPWKEEISRLSNSLKYLLFPIVLDGKDCILVTE